MRRAASGAVQARDFSTTPVSQDKGKVRIYLRTNPPFCHSYSPDLSPSDLFCAAQSPTQPIVLFVLVRLSPFRPFEVVDTVGPRVGHLKDAIMVKFKLAAAPHELLLFKLDSGSRTLLNSAQTLSEAGIATDTELEIAIVGQGACLRSYGRPEVCCTPFFALMQLIHRHYPSRSLSSSPVWVIQSCTAPMLSSVMDACGPSSSAKLHTSTLSIMCKKWQVLTPR